MDLISARSERALASAREVLRGALGRHLAILVDDIVGSLATVEAYIDFPDEDLPPEDLRRLEQRISSALAAANQMLATGRTGTLLREGIGTLIIGEPNVGKSSLLNRIVGRDRAIVSPEPGTTRDFIEERVNVGPHGLRLVDTAGLNPLAGGIEALGIEKTIELAAGADLFLLVVDATHPSPPLPSRIQHCIKASNTIIVINKMDLLGDNRRPSATVPPGMTAVEVSALNGNGFGRLIEEIARLAEGMQMTIGDERIAINARHAHYLAETRTCLTGALEKIAGNAPAELLASDLRGALGALGEISGKVDNERMLDQLFASFCIGK